MVEIIFAVIVLALLVYGLERNHTRQAKPGPRMFGSVNFDDREPLRGSRVISP
ncbi:MAG: hypothetical protein ABW224_05040 [Kibdelosporangium sp.]